MIRRPPRSTLSSSSSASDVYKRQDFACLLYTMLNNTPGEEKLRKIVTEAVEIEKEFVCDALPCALVGMNADMMRDYIEYVADHLLSQLGFAKEYNTANPFDWMELISLQGKTNFFEKRVGEYQKSGVTGGSGSMSTFALDEDF